MDGDFHLLKCGLILENYSFGKRFTATNNPPQIMINATVIIIIAVVLIYSSEPESCVSNFHLRRESKIDTTTNPIAIPQPNVFTNQPG